MNLFNNKFIKDGIAFICLLSSFNAIADFYVTTVSGEPQVFYGDFINSDIENVAGAEVSKKWSLGGNYQGAIHCERETMYQHSFLYRANTTLPASDLNQGFLKLNDYLDVKFEIFVQNGNSNAGRLVTVPFNDVNNNIFMDKCIPPQTTVGIPIKTGSEGKITVKLRKQVINGAAVSANHSIDLFARLSNMPGFFPEYGPVPIARVVFSAGEIVVPDTCTINNGNTVVVDFGDVGVENLDGKNHQEALKISYECSGGSFDSGLVNIKMGINAVPASFNSDYLKTSIEGLGIQISDQKGGKIIPNQFYSMNQSSRGEWNLMVAPVSKSGGISDSGFFDASATVIAEFE